MSRINVRLSQDTHDKLALVGKGQDLTASQIVRHGMRKYIEKPWVIKSDKIDQEDQKVLQIRIDEEMQSEFSDACAANGKSVSSVIRSIIEKAVNLALKQRNSTK